MAETKSTGGSKKPGSSTKVANEAGAGPAIAAHSKDAKSAAKSGQAAAPTQKKK
ncbi:hypothetical protein [Mesorhizobium sp. INR15]|uniref:hypothetical protein n=1 Tax=Mesorhizobium sp. INR15 TaxID=2654248 RepID=UPI0018967109|nr:hypothetical protein [Mesorhizobium sp. INR15]